MATINNHFNMYDAALKPKLLQWLIKEHLPEDKDLFSENLSLLSLISLIKTHKLLSEFASSSIDSKVVETWKSVVDDWINNLLLLVSCKIPVKCFAGICLLGVTCQECSSIRFMESCSLWFQKLLSHLQNPTDSRFLKIASLGSIADLITRFAGFLNVKKAEVLDIGKLIQSAIKLLNEDTAGEISEVVAHLFITILTHFPSSLRGASDIVESAVVSKLLDNKCDIRLRRKFSSCLALLPRTVADEGSWSAMMQKTLLLINTYLESAFEGLEQGNTSNDVFRLLVPPGKDPPQALGAVESDHAMNIPEQFVADIVSSLMICCSDLLTNGYSVQVSIPVLPLLVIIKRVLMVDGSVSQSMVHCTTAMQPELVCSMLPELHMYSLHLLVAVIKALDSQLLPHAADIIRLLKRYFRVCLSPKLRVKVYSVMKVLLISMGVGICMHLADDIVDNAILDLAPSSGPNLNPNPNPNPCAKASYYWSRKKRKREARCAGGGRSFEVEGAPSIPLKIAALEAVETLLTVGRGVLRARSSWRGRLDNVLMGVAESVCRWSAEENPGPNDDDGPVPLSSRLQLSSLRTLLASLLAPSLTRPPHLSPALRLFRIGKREGGVAVAELCTSALLSAEALIHPRALPLSCPPPPPIQDASPVNYNDDDEDDDLLRMWKGMEDGLTSVVEGGEAAVTQLPQIENVRLVEEAMDLQEVLVVVGSGVCEEEKGEGERMEVEADKNGCVSDMGLGRRNEMVPVWGMSPDEDSDSGEPCPDIVVGDGPDSDSDSLHR